MSLALHSLWHTNVCQVRNRVAQVTKNVWEMGYTHNPQAAGKKLLGTWTQCTEPLSSPKVEHHFASGTSAISQLPEELRL